MNGSVKIRLRSGDREIEIDGARSDVDELLHAWWEATSSGPSAGAAPAASGLGPTDSAGTGGGVGRHIKNDTTWTGTVAVDTTTTVDSGVTLTIAAGTTVKLDRTSSLMIAGSLDVEGDGTSVVTIGAASPNGTHGGLRVLKGGQLQMRYATLSGGGISIGTGGKATISDAVMSNPAGSGDFLVVDGGTLDMQYSELGLPTGDGTHTNIIVNGTSTIKVTHCSIRGAPYGLMLYGGTGSSFTYNNWENVIDVDAQAGVTGDFTGCYFGHGAPKAASSGQFTLATLSATALMDARPRP